MKYICIHGHFYQPPRENAWLEAIEVQDSAAPFHDWNERINFECYAPNTAARILDERQYIKEIINNYALISYNIGPTLLSWLEQADPEIYQKILEADKLSASHFGGHGSAMAQVHGHLILPLANERDKHTQVYWGIKDFEHRFGRKPDGMWLSETAVNTETLETLAENDIKFTVLAPRQAKCFRRIGENNWRYESIDTTKVYQYQLPSGKHIALFFYDGNISQEVAFNGLLNSGKGFARRLMSVIDYNNPEPQLVHIATDGESYGHHHRYGEMALADALEYLLRQPNVKLTNYAQFLALNPPQYEAQIYEDSSWSCVHGVERWRSDCGCNSGHAGWHQRWRRPLREALDWLRDKLIPIFEQEANKLVKDAWAARNDYIEVLLERSTHNVNAFFAKHTLKPLSETEKIKLLRLLEMQRNTLLMFTSCGWFFDEISGIETNQILQYACRAIDYTNQVSGQDLHTEFIERLALAPSNVYANGAENYLQHVVPSRVNLEKVGMHYAVASIFERFPQRLEVFNYVTTSEDFERVRAGSQVLTLGRTVVESRITHSEKLFSFAALYLGQHHIIGNISTGMSESAFDEMKIRIMDAFHSTNIADVISVMQQYFGSEKYTIWNLFTDEKRRVLRQITESSLKNAEVAFREIYNENYQLMAGMQRDGLPLPQVYRDAIEFVVNYDLQHYFTPDRLSIRELNRLATELKKWDIKIFEKEAFALSARRRIFQKLKAANESEQPLEQLELLNSILAVLNNQIGVNLDLWKTQNLYFSMIPKFIDQVHEFGEESEDIKMAFMRLGELLKIRT